MDLMSGLVSGLMADPVPDLVSEYMTWNTGIGRTRFTLNRYELRDVYQDVTDNDPIMPTRRTVPTRRAVLATGAAGVGAIALAACGSGGSGSGGGSRAGQNSAGGQQAEGRESSAAAPGMALTSVSDIKVGQAVSVKLPDGSPALVARPNADTVACFSAICTHMGCTVQPDGDTLHCPCHGSMFDPKTGQVTHGPAKRPLPKIPVHMAGGKVVTGP